LRKYIRLKAPIGLNDLPRHFLQSLESAHAQRPAGVASRVTIFPGLDDHAPRTHQSAEIIAVRNNISAWTDDSESEDYTGYDGPVLEPRPAIRGRRSNKESVNSQCRRDEIWKRAIDNK
jgi:hypothetical protein